MRNKDLHFTEFPKRRLDPRAYIGPLQTTQPTAERGDGNRPDVPRPDLLDQSDKASLEVFHPALASPVAFGREVDEVERVGQSASLENEPPPGCTAFRLQAAA